MGEYAAVEWLGRRQLGAAGSRSENGHKVQKLSAHRGAACMVAGAGPGIPDDLMGGGGPGTWLAGVIGLGAAPGCRYGIAREGPQTLSSMPSEEKIVT